MAKKTANRFKEIELNLSAILSNTDKKAQELMLTGYGTKHYEAKKETKGPKRIFRKEVLYLSR